MKNKEFFDEINNQQQKVKGENIELLVKLKKALEAKIPKYPKYWAPPSNSTIKTDELGVFTPTEYWKVLQPRTTPVK